MIYFTSDTHFGHTNVIKFCSRPFSDVDDMQAGLIKNWNRVVTPNDTVYHLGDFAFLPVTKAAMVLACLNGKKILVAGNHDKRMLRSHFLENHDYLELSYNGRLIVMCHYPIESWKNMSHGSIHLHGHSHGKSRTMANRFDVGVDVWRQAPVSVDELLNLAIERVSRPDRHAENDDE